MAAHVARTPKSSAFALTSIVRRPPNDRPVTLNVVGFAAALPQAAGIDAAHRTFYASKQSLRNLSILEKRHGSSAAGRSIKNNRISRRE